MDLPAHVAAGCSAASVFWMVSGKRYPGGRLFSTPGVSRAGLFFLLGVLMHPVIDICPHRDLLWITWPNAKIAPFLWELITGNAMVLILWLASPGRIRNFMASAGVGSAVPDFFTGVSNLGLMQKPAFLKFLHGKSWHGFGRPPVSVSTSVISQAAILLLSLALVYLLRKKSAAV